jgi:type II secretory pathway pseudopilin PulG
MSCGDSYSRRSAAGFTYIGLLALIVLIGLLLAAAGEVAGTTAQREREMELLWIGHQYRDAIARFYRINHQYPAALEDLVETASGGEQPTRYLRRLYRDPMTRATDWVLIPALSGGVMGVASASTRAPLKRARFDPIDVGFEDAEAYTGWVFIYDPRAAFLTARPGAGGPDPTR